MARRSHGTDDCPVARLQIEHVSHRSAAWRELWRQLFAAIEGEFARDASEGISPARGYVCNGGDGVTADAEESAC